MCAQSKYLQGLLELSTCGHWAICQLRLNGKPNSQAFCMILIFNGLGWTKGVSFKTHLPPHTHTHTHLTSTPSPSSCFNSFRCKQALVCECQWEAAVWLFYKLHYWFANTAQNSKCNYAQTPLSTPLTSPKTSSPPPSLYRFPLFDSVTFYQSVFNSCL